MKILKSIGTVLCLSMIIIACSPKVVEPVVEEQPKEIVRPPESDNPCTTFAKLSSRDRDEAETAYVLYKDMSKLKKYDAALPLWRKAYEMAPASNGRIKYQFDDGVAIYKHMFTNATSEEMKRSYIDSVMMVYDKRIECFGEPGYVEGRKAFDRYYTFSQYVDENETYEMFKRSIDGMGEEVKYFVINPFTKMLYDRVVAKEISMEEGRTYAMKVLSAVETGLSDCEGKECDAWNIVNEYSPKRLESLEGIKGFYDCTYFENKYYPEYLANPDDCDYINQVYRKLQYAGCASDHPKILELAQAKKTKCYVAPPEPGPLKQAFDLYNAGQFKDAVVKFDEFVHKTADPAKKFKYKMVAAKIYYGDIKNFPKARDYARKAAEINPSSGEPYLLIGKLYASSGPLCGPGTGWDSQIVCWPAVDKFEQAKRVDPSIAAEANKWIATYKKYMPKKEDVFLRTLKAGDSFRVGCWIQENTTIRTAD